MGHAPTGVKKYGGPPTGIIKLNYIVVHMYILVI